MITLFIPVASGVIGYRIGARKGWPLLGAVLGFFFPVLGWLPFLFFSDPRKCPHCRNAIPRDVLVCPICRQPLTVAGFRNWERSAAAADPFEKWDREQRRKERQN